MKITALLFTIGLLLLTSSLFSQTLKNGVAIDLMAPGFNMIGDHLLKTKLLDIKQERIPDFKDNIDYGAKLHAQQIYYWLKFNSLKITPMQNRLDIKIGLKDIMIQIKKARIYRKGWIDVSTTCHDINLYIAENKTLPLTASSTLQVVNNKIEVGEPVTNFQIPKNEYRVKGPRKCSGALGVGKLIASMVNSFLKNSKGRIEKAVQDQVKATKATIAQLLNDLFKDPISFNLGPILGSPKMILSFYGSPNHLTLSDKMSLSLDLKPALQNINFQNLHAGSLGINVNLLQFVLDKSMGSLKQTIEITEEDFPRIREIFAKPKAASIWPDINYAMMDVDYLRVFLSNQEPIKLQFDDEKNEIKLLFPRLRLQFKILQRGVWKRYFNTYIKLATAINLELDNQVLRANLKDDFTLEVTGAWTPDYTPFIDLFEQDMAEMIFLSMLKYIYASEETFQVPLPDFNLGSYQLSPKQLQFVDDSVWIQLYSNPL